jgi:hypothetical protein
MYVCIYICLTEHRMHACIIWFGIVDRSAFVLHHTTHACMGARPPVGQHACSKSRRRQGGQLERMHARAAVHSCWASIDLSIGPAVRRPSISSMHLHGALAS